MSTATSKKYETSEELHDLTGKEKITRGEAIKAIWAYAEENDLKTQKKYKGRNMGAIKSDSTLSVIIGKGVVSAPEIMKAIGKHLFSE